MVVLPQLINSRSGGITCRTCANRTAVNNGFSRKNFQGCRILPDRRNQWGVRHIKVTNPACTCYRNEKTGLGLEATIAAAKNKEEEGRP